METTIARIDSNGVITCVNFEEKPNDVEYAPGIFDSTQRTVKFGNLVASMSFDLGYFAIKFYSGEFSLSYSYMNYSDIMVTQPASVTGSIPSDSYTGNISQIEITGRGTGATSGSYIELDNTNSSHPAVGRYYYVDSESTINKAVYRITSGFTTSFESADILAVKPVQVSIGSSGLQSSKLTESADKVIYPSNYLDHIKISDDPYTPDNTYIQIMKSDVDNNLVEVGDQIVFNQSRYYDDGMTTRLYTKRAENSLYDASISYFRNDPQDFSFEAIFLKSNSGSPHNDINVLISKRDGSSGSGSVPVPTSGGFHLLQLVFNYTNTQQGYDCYVCDEALSETILPISWAQGPQYVSTINSATEILCSQLIESIYAKTIISNIQIIDSSDYNPIIKIGNTNYELSLQYAVSPASGGYDNVSFGTQKSSNLPVSYNFKNYNGDILFALNFLDNELTSISVNSNYNQDYAIIYSIDIIDLYTSTSTEFSSYRLTVNGVEYLSASGGGNNLYKLLPSSSDRLDIASDFISIIHSIDPFVGENQFVTADGSYFKTVDGEYFLVR